MKVDPVDLANVWEGYSSEGFAVQGKDQEISKDEWPKWQEVRQSKRIRANATFQRKINEQVLSDDHHEVEKEGTIATHSNSFAVLSNQHISDLASKMGIHTHSISLEKINMLKDLENARMDMVNKSEGSVDQSKCLEEEIFP
jgi:hypothetical protein